MKVLIKLTAICIITLSFLAFVINNSNKNNIGNIVLKDTSGNYADGLYQGLSQASYTGEPYWGQMQIIIQNNSFASIHFTIKDSNTHEIVDSLYGVLHFSGNPDYMQQCVNDGHGIEIYPQRLIESQNLDNVDAITGATWSYNIFKATANAALKDAKIPTGIIQRAKLMK